MNVNCARTIRVLCVGGGDVFGFEDSEVKRAGFGKILGGGFGSTSTQARFVGVFMPIKVLILWRDGAGDGDGFVVDVFFCFVTRETGWRWGG